jgi:4-hydroxybenzoyl-CoA reductase subunit alpha
VGEGPTGAVIPAILNALYDAIGVRFTEVPVTPEKILKVLGKI